MLQAVDRGCRPMLCHHADWVAAFLHGQRGVSDWNSALKLGFEPATECWPDWLLAQVRIRNALCLNQPRPASCAGMSAPSLIAACSPLQACCHTP